MTLIWTRELTLSTRCGLMYFSIAAFQIEESCLSTSESSVPEYVVVPRAGFSYSTQLVTIGLGLRNGSDKRVPAPKFQKQLERIALPRAR